MNVFINMADVIEEGINKYKLANGKTLNVDDFVETLNNLHKSNFLNAGRLRVLVNDEGVLSKFGQAVCEVMQSHYRTV